MIDYINDDIIAVAHQLLGSLVIHEVNGTVLKARIVDVECYLGDMDAASHAYKGRRTQRMDAMFLPGGHLYLYTMRGLTLCNLVCGDTEQGIGIMLRALEPVEGIDTMEKLRNSNGVNLTNGPAKLCEAMGITMALYGTKIGDEIRIDDTDRWIPKEIIALPRIGIPNKGEWTDKALRFVVKGNPYISNISKKDIDEDYGWLKGPVK